MLDSDVDGEVSRICPDAPAPVFDERSIVERPGGAGLAAMMAAADGLDVVLVTAVADDPAGARLRALLAAAGVETLALRRHGTTVEKVRLRSGRQTLLRLDRGTGGGPVSEPTGAVLDAIADADAVLVSDYGHGVARHPALRRALADARPAVWDPHPRGPAAVAGTGLVTPNESELRRLTGTADGGRRLAVNADAARVLRERWRIGAVAVTMGADGALLCHSGPAPLVVAPPEVADAGTDTCGAGDRFAVAAATALANGALVSEAVQEAVVRASEYVREGGASRLHAATGGSRTEAGGQRAATAAPPQGPVPAVSVVARVRARGGTVVATGGCFDLLHAGHLATLQAARALGDCLVVCLNSDRSVAGLKGPDRPVTPEADRARLLAAMQCVDAVIVFDEPTPDAVLARLRPDIWVKGGDYAGGAELPEAGLVRRWGGQTVIVPYLPGRSTTATIAATRAEGARILEETP
jgi:rfaE bifunctional protein nucleotidyltransferase chain/domain/rfaE bifunctional protein kinase chain/domain